jgi:glutaredoxin 3
MLKVLMYCTALCPYCIRAERLLAKKGVDINKVRVDLEPDQFEKMIDESGRHTVPQIFIGDRHVGGYDDLAQLDYIGELDELLSKA